MSDLNMPDNIDKLRKNVIALVDCDSFFVSCEQSVNPELKGKPVCVMSGRGQCVISRSKEAKKLGIKMGMPYFQVEGEMKKAVFITANHDLYSEISQKVMAVLKSFSPSVEVYSIDEAFVDLTGLERLYKRSYPDIAYMIREKVLEEVDIPVSIGISSSKSLAKLASDKAKTFGKGVFVVQQSDISQLLTNTSIDEIWGIGKNFSLMLRKNGILTAKELVSQPDAWLDSKIGIRGLEMKHELLGEMVSPISNDIKLPKSIQKTSALAKFTSDKDYLKNSLNYHIHRACVKLRKINAKCKGVSIFLRTKDFKVYCEKQVLTVSSDFELEISDIVFEMLDKIYNPQVLYRSTGVILDTFVLNSAEQMSLFANSDDKRQKLSKCFDKLEQKFGKDIIQTGFIKKDV
jgi:nucleotidyltransferase/DNA polymerase involved in DNA repair